MWYISPQFSLVWPWLRQCVAGTELEVHSHVFDVTTLN